MNILSVRLPLVLMCSPPTFSDEAFTASQDITDDSFCSKVPLLAPTVRGSILWEADSESGIYHWCLLGNVFRTVSVERRRREQDWAKRSQSVILAIRSFSQHHREL